MSAAQKVIAAHKLFLAIVYLCILFSALGIAQTSLNDVHVIQRQDASIAASADSPQLIAHWDLPIIRTDANLVLVPVSVTDPMQRLVTGLHKDNFEVFEGKTPQNHTTVLQRGCTGISRYHSRCEWQHGRQD